MSVYMAVTKCEDCVHTLDRRARTGNTHLVQKVWHVQLPRHVDAVCGVANCCACHLQRRCCLLGCVSACHGTVASRKKNRKIFSSGALHMQPSSRGCPHTCPCLAFVYVLLGKEANGCRSKTHVCGLASHVASQATALLRQTCSCVEGMSSP